MLNVNYTTELYEVWAEIVNTIVGTVEFLAESSFTGFTVLRFENRALAVIDAPVFRSTEQWDKKVDPRILFNAGLYKLLLLSPTRQEVTDYMFDIVQYFPQLEETVEVAWLNDLLERWHCSPMTDSKALEEIHKRVFKG